MQGSLYGNLYRNFLLPAFERSKGRSTIRYWKEAEESQWKPRKELEEFQLHALRDLLSESSQAVPYHKRRWQELGLNLGALQSLKDFQVWPIMTRADMNAHGNEMLSSRVTDILWKATGGSSGEPLRFALNLDSNDRRTAMTHRGYNWAGAGPGSKQIHLWGTALGNISWIRRKKVELHQAFQRQKLLSCFEMDDDSMLAYAKSIDRYRPDSIIAYTNPIYELAMFLEREGRKVFSPKSIVVGAEKLHDYQRETIERVFNSPVFETYGSREFMLIGAECELHQGLHLSMENLIVEILNDDLTLTASGEEGNVVITDLFNRGMPFIRYANGDRAVAGFAECSCGRGLPLLSKVAGRELDVLILPNGKRLPGEFFPHLLKDFPWVKQFQVVQESRDQIALRIVEREATEDQVRDQLRTAIQNALGGHATIQLELVAEIPLTKAGKRRVVVRCAD